MFTSQRTLPYFSKIKCILTSDKDVYKIGEIPKLTVKIYNETKNDIYLIGSLDGSDVNWRFPHCYYSINRPKPNKTEFQRCGNMNILRIEDFKVVKAGQVFNPYENIDNSGFFMDYNTTNKETFENPGIYKIRFHYSTNSQDINDFLGDKFFRINYSDSLKLDSLFKLVPRIEITSNEITIRIEK